jgi:integrase
VLLSLNTGMRRGETFTLCWEDVDLSRRVITIRGSSSKSGNTRHIPLTSESVSVLNLWRSSREVSNLVFPSDDGGEFGSMKTAWANLMKKARIQNFRWHDMRHHFASQLVMAGVDLNTVRELLGHQSLEMTLRYAHLSEDHKTAAIAKLENQTIRHGS